MAASERQERTSANVAAHAYILAKKLAKLLLDQKLRVQVSLLRLLGVVDFPVPTYTQMLGIGSHSIRHYYESGINCYVPIAVAALRAGLDLHGGIRVLDFGCGAGRQLQHFTRRFPAGHYHACDVNEPAIGFVRRHLPQVQAFRSRFRPPLPLETGSFDMIYSVSVFSHLSPDDQRLWLEELARLTRPGGYAFLTTEGFTGLQLMSRAELPQDLEARRAELAARGIIFRDFADRPTQKDNERLVTFGSKYLGIEGSYGTTVVSPDYIRRTWSDQGFVVEGMIEGIIDHRQDLVILRRA